MTDQPPPRDLAPCDLYLLPKLKEYLRTRILTTTIPVQRWRFGEPMDWVHNNCRRLCWKFTNVCLHFLLCSASVRQTMIAWTFLFPRIQCPEATRSQDLRLAYCRLNCRVQQPVWHWTAYKCSRLFKYYFKIGKIAPRRSWCSRVRVPDLQAWCRLVPE